MILRQFLVALGFRVDQYGLTNFNRAVGRSTVVTQNLGRAAIWAAAAVVGAVAIISRQLEKLYFTSLKTGDSAASIFAWSEGMERAGFSAEKARGMLESFSLQAMNPGRRALLTAFGVTASDTSAQIDQLVASLQKYRLFDVRAAYAGQFGISPDDLRTLELTAGIRARAQRDAADILKQYDVDAKSATEKAKVLDDALAGVGRRFEALGMNFVDKLAGPMTEWIHELNKLIDGTNALLNRWSGGKEDVPEFLQPKGDKLDVARGAGVLGSNYFQWLYGSLIPSLMEFHPGVAAANYLGDEARSGRWATPGGHISTDAQIDAALARAAANPGQDIQVNVYSRDPGTTVEVVPLGQGSARNFDRKAN